MVSATLSIASSAVLPATGMIEIAAPVTRMGTVMILVSTHPLRYIATMASITSFIIASFVMGRSLMSEFTVSRCQC